MNIEKLKEEFAVLGLKIIHSPRSINCNGPDLWVQRKSGRPLSVEVKKVRRLKNKTVQVPSVERSRRNDDLIAIICNSEYILIEPMKDHLKCCSTKGTRQLTLLLGGRS